ncbi:hypothetical protein GCM10025789_02940 [Tessaracoccus lubricantis]|uniref:Uncharacterized protein n=1 Tax=Tessaracoccus lubricantis TaxID=545543 RepID=A0ABP9EY97_9ACTN
MLKTVRVALAAIVAVTGAVALAPNSSADTAVDVYSTPGVHNVNGRQWRTTCEPYSVTQRCRTEIQATVVSWDGAKFVQKTDWAFNNLTYLPSPRATWKGNPLAASGTFASAGRQWRTECDTAATGRGACRSYIQADVIAKTAAGFQWQTQWVFNSMVRFSTSAPAPTPTPSEPVFELPGVDIAPADAPDVAGWDKEAFDGIVLYSKEVGTQYAFVVAQALGDVEGGADFFIQDLTEVQKVGSATCGVVTETDEEGEFSMDVCVFTTTKYGVVLVTADGTTKAELHEVVGVLSTKLP